MTSPTESGRIPCVDEPRLQELDKDGDGILSLHEIVSTFPDQPQVQELVQALETRGIVGIRYTGCDDLPADPDGSSSVNGGGEDIATLIARAAIAQIYGNSRG